MKVPLPAIDFRAKGCPRPHSFDRTPQPLQGQWKATVSQAARSAMGSQEPTLENVAVEMLFTYPARGGESDGTPCSTPVRPGPKPGQWSKQDRTIPDTDNLAKLVLDAMEGIVYANDVQVVDFRARKVFGPEPGVWVTVCVP
jgi:hypothetical protein